MADDPRSPFTNIDVEAMPEPPEDDTLPAEEIPPASETARETAEKIKLVL